MNLPPPHKRLLYSLRRARRGEKRYKDILYRQMEGEACCGENISKFSAFGVPSIVLP